MVPRSAYVASSKAGSRAMAGPRDHQAGRAPHGGAPSAVDFAIGALLLWCPTHAPGMTPASALAGRVSVSSRG